MPSSTAINQTLTDAQKIIDTWTANPSFTLGEITLKSFTATRDQVAKLSDQIDTRRTELQGMMNARDDLRKVLHEQVTRARSGFRAVYGPDSTQYDQSGGKRLSEHRPRVGRKRTLAKSAAA